jgi:hypothetical protein
VAQRSLILCVTTTVGGGLEDDFDFQFIEAFTDFA